MKNPLEFMGYCLNEYFKCIDKMCTPPTEDELNGIEVIKFSKFIKR